MHHGAGLSRPGFAHQKNRGEIAEFCDALYARGGQPCLGIADERVDFLVSRTAGILRTFARRQLLLPAFEPQKDACADDANHPETNAQHPDIAPVQVQDISQKPDEDEVNQ